MNNQLRSELTQLLADHLEIEAGQRDLAGTEPSGRDLWVTIADDAMNFIYGDRDEQSGDQGAGPGSDGCCSGACGRDGGAGRGIGVFPLTVEAPDSADPGSARSYLTGVMPAGLFPDGVFYPDPQSPTEESDPPVGSDPEPNAQ